MPQIYNEIQDKIVKLIIQEGIFIILVEYTN